MSVHLSLQRVYPFRREVESGKTLYSTYAAAITKPMKAAPSVSSRCKSVGYVVIAGRRARIDPNSVSEEMSRN